MTRGMGGKSPSNIAHNLKGVDFPARKNQLIEKARQNEAEQAVLSELERMPEREYRTMADVMHEYGKIE